MPGAALILGCGFTGRRVARRLLDRGLEVHATSRAPARLGDLAAAGVRVHRLDAADASTLRALSAAIPAGAVALHSVPPVAAGGALVDPTPALLGLLASRLARVVYLSTTGVYGEAREVDEHTAPAPVTDRGRVRVEAERAVAAVRSWLVLRPAAIYGPGRGVHEAIRSGRYRLAGEGRNHVSRIHVDDLAALVEAALLSELGGAWPVADDEPAQAREVAAFCASLLGVPVPPPAAPGTLDETLEACPAIGPLQAGARLPDRASRQEGAPLVGFARGASLLKSGPEWNSGLLSTTDRVVDGRAIRRRLGVELAYPSFRTGIPAALAAVAAVPARG